MLFAALDETFYKMTTDKARAPNDNVALFGWRGEQLFEYVISFMVVDNLTGQVVVVYVLIGSGSDPWITEERVFL